MRIGILALQGAFLEHKRVLDNLGVDAFYIKNLKDIARDFDGLILPGGESTTIAKLLKDLDLYRPLKERIDCGLPVFGTCAGLILMAKRVVFDPPILSFNCMDITARRNGYGRQLDSFVKNVEFDGRFWVDAVFIRAPLIVEVGSDVKSLACIDGRVVAARQNNLLCCSFHPELSGVDTVHRYFLNMVKSNRK